MGQSHVLKVSRLHGLMDGIFAIAMTILVLDLRLPAGIDTSTLALVLKTDVSNQLFVYVVSFIILGTQWVAMNFQHAFLEQANRLYLWTNILYLMAICVVPFSASLVAAHPLSEVSILFYAANLIWASFCQFFTCQCAHYFKLNNEAYSDKVYRAVVRRIFVAPLFYFAAIIVAHWNTTLAFMLLAGPTLIYIIPGRVDKYA